MNARAESCCQGTENTYLDDELGQKPVCGQDFCIQDWALGALHLAAAAALCRFRSVVLMHVQEASNFLLQLRRVTRLAHGSGVIEKLPLEASRQIIPLREHRRPEAL
jgi:hypothetical protein